MTSRLKRKLNDLGVDTGSAKANENFCLIGTPLPPLEKLKDKGEFVPLWKQDVRDEKGRRRLHGAFTGGFSAGYFNTVGSKEGWTPSTFVSSRSERAKQKAVQPEDFMDEEDLAELRENMKMVDENEEMDFAGTAGELRKRKGEGDEEDDSMARALATSLAPPPQDSAGARILRKMGWRPGQGIGSRLTYEQRKAQNVVYGYSSTSDEGDDEEAKKHMYPRRDTPLLLVPRKDNAHGLGYQPGMGLNESLGRGGAAGAVKETRLAAGFGLGALNDAEQDDLDVYDSALGPKGHSRLAYDEHADDDHIAIGSSRKSRYRPSESRVSSEISSSQTFKDGRPALKGFIVSTQPVMQDLWFPLPEVPQGWTPHPRRVWESDKNKENINAEKREKEGIKPQTHHEWKENQLSADQRGSMLGETPLPSKPRSVFEYISQKDRERLQNIRDAVPGPSASATVPPPAPEPGPSTTRGQLHIPNVHPSVAKAALQGFQPFTSDPVKQSRYIAFLNFSSSFETTAKSSAESIGIGPMPGQSIDEFNKELADYAKAATVFKPLSGAMAGRFRTAIIVENGPKIIEGLHTPDLTSTPEPEPEKQEKEEEDPRQAAVRLGMYGPLTREVKSWQPARLLCKRFGVKEPEVEMTAEDLEHGVGKQAEHAAAETGGSLAKLIPAITDGSAAGEADQDGSRPRDLANVGLGDDESQGRDTLTYVRPPMDVFKAIFASDDEESDEEEEEAMNEEISPPATSSLPEVKTGTLPSHLAAAESIPASYEPQANGSSATIVPASEKVDLGTFKPTFVPRSERESRKDKPKKDKDKKKKPKAAIVSFDDDEEGLQVSIGGSRKEKRKDKDEERKKKKRKEKKQEDEDDSMWVEAPPPEAVQKLAASSVQPSDTTSPQSTDFGGQTAGPPRGRKRAIDFM